MEPRWRACSCTSINLVSASTPDNESESPTLLARMNRLLVYNAPFMVPLVHSMATVNSKRTPSKKLPPEFESSDDLEPGDRVEVRSEQEVLSTLNADRKLKGLAPMPEMVKHYGKEYRVFKKLNKIMIESTGELRAIKSPTYMLEEVFCDGEFHQHCDRSCFLLWKREWLKKI
jgi:hypothetical protein